MQARTALEPNTTGGWLWHLRAIWRRHDWKPTTHLIAEWLHTTRPLSKHLLLIGGSAGWMMPSSWLQGFSEVDLVDIDPWAYRLFQLNHGRALEASMTHLRFLRVDGLSELEYLLAQYPQASVFFDNVLGQQIYRCRDVYKTERALTRAVSCLAGRDWGSIHDLYSGPTRSGVAASVIKPIEAFAGPTGPVVGKLREIELHRHLLEQVGGYPYWVDHLTSTVFPSGTRTTLIAWSFAPSYAHWLQAGWVAAPS
jgi:hypothetical protein